MKDISEQSGIYAIVNLFNGKKYIGATINFQKRFQRHKNYLIVNKHPNTHLQYSWNKYTENNFKFVPILICQRCDLDYYEIAFIKLYKTTNTDILPQLKQVGFFKTTFVE